VDAGSVIPREFPVPFEARLFEQAERRPVSHRDLRQDDATPHSPDSNNKLVEQARSNVLPSPTRIDRHTIDPRNVSFTATQSNA
jgi:hypothetical protein